MGVSDYMNWLSMLKGNYRKGAWNMKRIVGDDRLMSAFAASPDALSIVYTFDCRDCDPNALELCGIVAKSELSDECSLAYLGEAVGVKTMEECLENIEAVLASPGAVNALMASNDLLQHVAADADALSSVLRNSYAASVVGALPHAAEVIVSSNAGVETIAANPELAAIALGKKTFVDAMMSSDTAPAIICTSAEAMKLVAADGDIMSRVAASGRFMEAVAANEAAMAACSASAVAMHRICKVGSARSAFMSSEFADASFDVMYDTLSAAPTLFAKNTNHWSSLSSSGTSQTTGSGSVHWTINFAKDTSVFEEVFTSYDKFYGKSNSGTYGAEYSFPHSAVVLLKSAVTDSVTFNGILANGIYVSTQTRETVLTTTNETAVVNKVLVGGMTYWSSNRYIRGGNMKARYAVFVAL